MRTLAVLLALSGCTWMTSSTETVDTDGPQVVVQQSADRWDASAAPDRPVAEGPNVVLVLVCTWRADQLGPWGGPDAVAPTLERLVAEGVAFDTTVSAAPWTRPASAALLTGAHPDTIGMADPEPGPSRQALAPSVTTLAERLHAAGWSTVGIASNPNLNAAWGFDQGFDAYYETSLSMADHGGGRKVPGTMVVDAVLERVAARPDTERPVYLQVVLVDPHAPLDFEAEAVAPFAGDDVPGRLARYRTGLHRADQAVQALLDGLPRAGLDPSETLLVLVGDHGEGLSLPASHGPGHGNYLYPSTVRVPWVVHGPGVGTGRIGGLSQSIDVTPTILGLVGVPGDESLQGIDLSPAVRAGEGTVPREVAFTSTRFQASDRAAAYTDTTQCQLDRQPKRTARAVTQGRGRPFHTGCCAWREDPACDQPVHDAELMESLQAWSRQQDRALEAADRRQVTPDADLEAQLRALGYRP